VEPIEVPAAGVRSAPAGCGGCEGQGGRRSRAGWVPPRWSRPDRRWSSG